jgi:apolipoprotein N-acyltransferase
VNISPKIIALVAGLFSALGFAPLNLWPVTLLCFALLLASVAAAPSLKSGLARGYWFGVGHFIVGLNWIAGAFQYQHAMPAWFGWIAVVLLSLFLAIYPAIAAGLAWRWGRDKPLVFVLFFAAAWVAAEYLRAIVFTGFAWNPLGVITAGLGAGANIVGTYGLSGMVVLSAGALWLASKRNFSGAALAFVPPAIALLMGAAAVLGPVDRASGPLVRVVQPNIGQQDKHVPEYDVINFRKLESLTGVPGARPRLILWPEAAIPDFLEEEEWARARIASLMGPKDMLLTGGSALIYDKSGDLIGARNSMFAIAPDSRIVARYDKSHLVPGGEYLPMKSFFSAIGLARLVPGDIDFWPGPGPKSYTLPGFGKVGVQICYEIIFSGQVVDKTNRPDFLFNPSNDAWFGSWGPPQHLAQARLRAIEEGLPIVRSTPTGISAVIDGKGRVLNTLPYHRAGSIETRLPKALPPTLFARHGNFLPLAFALLLCSLGIALRAKRR